MKDENRKLAATLISDSDQARAELAEIIQSAPNSLLGPALDMARKIKDDAEREGREVVVFLLSASMYAIMEEMARRAQSVLDGGPLA